MVGEDGPELEEAGEPLQGDEGPDDEDDDECSVDSSHSSSTEGASAAKKKKKNKKKKKKKKSDALAQPEPSGQGGGDGAAGRSASSSSSNSSSSSSVPTNNGNKSKSEKQELDKRFNAALEGARKGEEFVMLSQLGLQHAKAKKLFESLKTCETVTSVNLSGNLINDEGVQAIAGVLGVNGLPSLIQLDLRDNPLTGEGLKVLEGLQKLRKQVTIMTGAKPSELVTAPKAGNPPELKDASKGKMFRKFFQTGDEDDDEGGLSRQESILDDRGINPAELWEQIKAKQRDGCLTELSAKLQQLCTLLQRETKAIQSAGSNSLDGSKPHLKECVSNLPVLASCLDMEPRRLMLQCSPNPLAAVGSHRVAAAEAVSLLLSPNNAVLDRAVSGSKLVALVLHLSLQQPLSSVLHVRALQLLRSCLASSVPDLTLPLMQAGWGAGLTGLQSTPSASTAHEAGGAELPCCSFPEVLVTMATAAVSVPSGARSPIIGYVLEQCKALKEVGSQAQDGKGNKPVAAALSSHPTWSRFAAEGGALAVLLAEQSGDLCGPRPVRPLEEEGQLGGDMEGLNLTGHMSGREIMALLQTMSALGVGSDVG